MSNLVSSNFSFRPSFFATNRAISGFRPIGVCVVLGKERGRGIVQVHGDRQFALVLMDAGKRPRPFRQAGHPQRCRSCSRSCWCRRSRCRQFHRRRTKREENGKSRSCGLRLCSNLHGVSLRGVVSLGDGRCLRLNVIRISPSSNAMQPSKTVDCQQLTETISRFLVATECEPF